MARVCDCEGGTSSWSSCAACVFLTADSDQTLVPALRQQPRVSRHRLLSCAVRCLTVVSLPLAAAQCPSRWRCRFLHNWFTRMWTQTPGNLASLAAKNSSFCDTSDSALNGKWMGDSCCTVCFPGGVVDLKDVVIGEAARVHRHRSRSFFNCRTQLACSPRRVVRTSTLAVSVGRRRLCVSSRTLSTPSPLGMREVRAQTSWLFWGVAHRNRAGRPAVIRAGVGWRRRPGLVLRRLASPNDVEECAWQDRLPHTSTTSAPHHHG